VALSMGFIVSGNILVETIFAYPGMGYLLYVAIMGGDYTLIQGVVFILILATALTVLFLDLTYPLLDPRITYRRR
jgi:peptide/nickel transport system permease protein